MENILTRLLGPRPNNNNSHEIVTRWNIGQNLPTILENSAVNSKIVFWSLQRYSPIWLANFVLYSTQ